MQIYFLRHGIAADQAPSGSDSARALTPEGIAHMEEEAHGLQRLEVVVDLLLSSPLTRAQQTAEIVGHALGLQPIIEPALSAGMSMNALLATLDQYQARRVMIVGHEPDLSMAIGTLTGGSIVSMKKGGLALVELPYDDSSDGVLHWLLPPRILRAIGKR
jgi:phosphohistidine phosphatase